MAATTEPPPLDEANLLEEEPGPTPTITPTSPSPPPAEEHLILSDDPVTEDLESPFDDPADLLRPVALDDGPEFEPVSLGSEPSAALPENRGQYGGVLFGGPGSFLGLVWAPDSGVRKPKIFCVFVRILGGHEK